MAKQLQAERTPPDCHRTTSSAELQAFLRSRRSVRRFLPAPVPDELVLRILETATWAPSAHNRQPWRFAVLASPDVKVRLAEALGADFLQDLLADGVETREAQAVVERSRRRLEEAPLAIVLCLDPSMGDVYSDPARQQAEFIMGVQSVALAGGTLLLAAHAEGLGGVWVCAPLFAPQTVQRVLELPTAWQPQALLLLGYPARLPEPRPRRTVEEVAVFS